MAVIYIYKILEYYEMKKAIVKWRGFFLDMQALF